MVGVGYIRPLHRLSAVTVVSARFPVFLGVRFQKSGETEAACSLALLKELVAKLGKRFIDILVAGALYLQTPFVQALESLGLEWVINLKDNQPDLAAEAELLTNRPAGCRDASAQEEFELWHLPEVDWPAAGRLVRVVKTVRVQNANRVGVGKPLGDRRAGLPNHHHGLPPEAALGSSKPCPRGAHPGPGTGLAPWRWASTSARCAAMRAPPRPAFARWRGSSAARFSRRGSIPVEILPPLSARAAVHLPLPIRRPPLAPCPPIPLAGFIHPPGGPEPRFYRRKPPLQVLLLALQRKTPFRPCGYRATIRRPAKSLAPPQESSPFRRETCENKHL